MEKKVLNWYKDNGVLDFVEEKSVNHFELFEEKKKQKQKPKPKTEFVSDNIKSRSMDDIVNLLALKYKNGKKENKPQNFMTPQHFIQIARETSDRVKTLEELRKEVENFEGCHSIKKLATNTVFGEGDPESKILIIGEAPGNNEDLQGRPFCGQSGMLLDNMFEAIGHKREALYITNTLFWRPPGNRTPTPEEVAMCRPFVEKHIALINPKVIIMMGSTAFTSLLNVRESITRARRKFFDYQNQYTESAIKATALFHPSYLLRQPIKKRDTWKDLLIIKEFLESNLLLQS